MTDASTHANEVVANVALELMGRGRSDCAALHPNDDVNMAQSTNDAYPTVLRLAVILATEPGWRAAGRRSARTCRSWERLHHVEHEPVPADPLVSDLADIRKHHPEG